MFYGYNIIMVNIVYVAGEAKTIGRGGTSMVVTATGMSRTTITGAMKELHRMFCHITQNWRGGTIGKSGGYGKLNRKHYNRKRIGDKGGVG